MSMVDRSNRSNLRVGNTPYISIHWKLSVIYTQGLPKKYKLSAGEIKRQIRHAEIRLRESVHGFAPLFFFFIYFTRHLRLALLRLDECSTSAQGPGDRCNYIYLFFFLFLLLRSLPEFPSKRRKRAFSNVIRYSFDLSHRTSIEQTQTKKNMAEKIWFRDSMNFFFFFKENIIVVVENSMKEKQCCTGKVSNRVVIAALW